MVGLPAATVNARVVGVGVGRVDSGDVWSTLPPTRGSPGAGGTMVRPFAERVWAWESVAVPWCVTDVAGSGAATDVARFVRERERDRETTLRTRSRRLPVDEDGVRVWALPLTPSDLSDTGIVVGIPLSVSGAEDEEWSRLAIGRGRPRSFSSFTRTAES